VLASLRACHAPSAPSAAGSGAPPRRARRARRERPSAAAPRGRQARVSAPAGGARRQSATAQHARVSPPSRCAHAAPSAAAEQLAPRGAQCGGPGAVHTPACAAAPAFAPHLQVLEHGERCRHLLHRLAAQHHVVRAVGAVDGDGQVCARRGRVRGCQREAAELGLVAGAPRVLRRARPGKRGGAPRRFLKWRATLRATAGGAGVSCGVAAVACQCPSPHAPARPLRAPLRGPGPRAAFRTRARRRRAVAGTRSRPAGGAAANSPESAPA